MKFCLLLTLVLSFNLYAEKNDSTMVSDISGIWADSACTGNFSECELTIAQRGNDLHMMHTLKFKKQFFMEEGDGKIDSNHVQWDVLVTRQIPGWATAGTHFLSLSKDKKTLRGHYEDNKGNKGPIVFKRTQSVGK